MFLESLVICGKSLQAEGVLVYPPIENQTRFLWEDQTKNKQTTKRNNS